MLHFTLFADATGLIYSASGLVLQIGVGVAIIFIIRAAVETVSFLGKVSTRVGKAGDGLTNKARDRVQQTPFYQRREMSRNYRKQERNRAATEDFAERMENSPRWRRRAAGRGNQAGQQRAEVYGIGAQMEMEEKEISSADRVLKARNVQSMAQLGTIITGGQVNGVTGDNDAVLRAAIRRVIAAQDAQQLERAYMHNDPRVQTILRNEISNGAAYATTKGAGAHLVTAATLGNGGAPVSGAQLDRAALTALSALSPDKLAQQDGPALQAAARGFAQAQADIASGALTAAHPDYAGVTQAIDDMQRKVSEVRANANSLNSIKESGRVGFDTMPGSGFTTATGQVVAATVGNGQVVPPR